MSKKPPCIRGLFQFKKGCPERTWDGEEGCPCWIEMSVPTRSDPEQHVTKKQCIDKWLFDFQWSTLGLLEGNQGAVESFRNAMCTPDPKDPFNANKATPKPDPAMLHLVKLFESEKQNREAVIAYQVKKSLTEGNKK